MGVSKNLVLGGSGLIGSALMKYLHQIGEEAINIDLKEGNDLREMDLSPYVGVDYVWFLAWDVGGAKYLTAEKNLLQILRNNTIICEKVFHFLELTNIPFLFTTTQLADTHNTYGITKILGEEWTRLLGGQMARLWNVYGWEEPGERSHVIPDLVIQGLLQKKINLLTTGIEERQFVYVEDAVKNLVTIRNQKIPVADLTNGNWISIKDVTASISILLNVPYSLGDVVGYHHKIEPNIHSSLSYQFNLEQGIRVIIDEAKNYISANGLK
ncbi:MAG: NAD(P)-dependent oxidoreductase [Chitinophagales bacterium]|nr:NAD(P)-dependent oxidoreductase [Chitinophagales bacterium]